MEPRDWLKRASGEGKKRVKRRPFSRPARTAMQEKASAVAGELARAAVIDPPEVFSAALPARLIEKGLPGVGLLIHLLLSRFEDHLPFYRLEKTSRAS